MKTDELENVSSLNRMLQPKHRRFLSYWFWTWPLMGMVVVTIHWFDQEIFRNCMHALFVPGLVGTVSAGWTIVRANARDYSLQFCASVVILAVGVTMFWRATQ
jgi:hypothetical protein